MVSLGPYFLFCPLPSRISCLRTRLAIRMLIFSSILRNLVLLTLRESFLSGRHFRPEKIKPVLLVLLRDLWYARVTLAYQRTRRKARKRPSNFCPVREFRPDKKMPPRPRPFGEERRTEHLTGHLPAPEASVRQARQGSQARSRHRRRRGKATDWLSQRPQSSTEKVWEEMVCFFPVRDCRPEKKMLTLPGGKAKRNQGIAHPPLGNRTRIARSIDDPCSPPTRPRGVDWFEARRSLPLPSSPWGRTAPVLKTSMALW
jgi:hypothetical protein